MNSLARNFAMKFGLDAPAEFGQTFSYTKVYLGMLNGEFVTLESYLNGTFQKYINNTGNIFGEGSELSMKAESFVHYCRHTRCKLCSLRSRDSKFDTDG